MPAVPNLVPAVPNRVRRFPEAMGRLLRDAILFYSVIVALPFLALLRGILRLSGVRHADRGGMSE